MKTKLFTLLLSAAALFVLTGCAVLPEAIGGTELGIATGRYIR